ncbi:MAG: helix-turn-helix domain-containing protein [Aminipila sp.]
MNNTSTAKVIPFMADTVIPKMVTIKEAATATGLAVNHVRNLCTSGEITAVRTGKKWLVNLDRFVDYLNTPPTPSTDSNSAVRRIAE